MNPIWALYSILVSREEICEAQRSGTIVEYCVEQLAVIGLKGVGKSCLLLTALHLRFRVVTISVIDTLYLHTDVFNATLKQRFNLEITEGGYSTESHMLI